MFPVWEHAFPWKKALFEALNARLQKWRAWERRSNAFPHFIPWLNALSLRKTQIPEILQNNLTITAHLLVTFWWKGSSFTGLPRVLESTWYFSPKFKALKVLENRAGAWKSLNLLSQTVQNPKQLSLHVSAADPRGGGEGGDRPPRLGPKKIHSAT